MYNYDVDIHFKGWGWDTYIVKAECIDNARYIAVKRVIDETGIKNAENIDCVRVYKCGTDKMLKEYDI